MSVQRNITCIEMRACCICRNKHINPAFIKYRKSVADDYAAIEWRDGTPGGVTLIDSNKREYYDCLGGFGIYNVGHSHPTVVAAVQAQLVKQPLHSQVCFERVKALTPYALR